MGVLDEGEGCVMARWCSEHLGSSDDFLFALSGLLSIPFYFTFLCGQAVRLGSLIHRHIIIFFWVYSIATFLRHFYSLSPPLL